jgi:hypothetical protein
LTHYAVKALEAFSTRVGHDTEPAGEEVINVDPESGENY